MTTTNGATPNPTPAAKAKTRNEKAVADVAALLRSRHGLLWVVTREEVRAEAGLAEAAALAKMKCRLWDCARGIVEAAGSAVVSKEAADPSAAIDFVDQAREGSSNAPRCVYVFRDLHKWFDPVVLRKLRNVARSLQLAATPRAIVILTPSADVPPELAGHVTVVDWPLPDAAEIARILQTAVDTLPADYKATGTPSPDAFAQIVDAAVGLTAEEAGNCFALSLAKSRSFDPVIVAAEKKRVIAREKVLTWHDPDPRGLDAIGGLEVLKGWLKLRRSAFTPAARAFGLPAPKGALLVGVPGTGKSLTAKAVAAAWQMPLLRLDMGALRSKYVGESEANIRKALKVAEAVAPCVLWLDEIEKALAGASGPQGDGGVSSDALGAVLSWMQDREGSVFVLATANDVRALPPELLRKGRFDELFWIDLPTESERRAIVRATVTSYGRECTDEMRDAVADATPGFTGAEIAALVPDALFQAFTEGERALTTEDLVGAASCVVPLSKTAGEKLDELRSWAKGRARKASVDEVADPTAGARRVDLD